jgi:hypothetical protein
VATSARLRKDLAALSGLAAGDLDVIWREVSTAALAAEALNDVLPALVATYGSAAAALAADWYDELRDARGVAGRFSAIPAHIPDPGTGALVGWATSQATDLTALQTLVVGGVQRRIVNFSRLTVTGSSIADPKAVGWRRVGDGSNCEFCSMLLGRGAVYTEATADFQAHDHCNCGAEPEFV